MATKSTTTTTNKIVKRLQTPKPKGTTIATSVEQGEQNTVKVSNTSQGAKATRNTKLYPTTITSPENADTTCYADVKRSSGSDRAPPAEFESTVDGQENLQAKIPEWTMTGDANINDPHAVTRTNMEIGNYRGTVNDKDTLPVPSYHKSPATKVHDENDNMNISQQGSLGNLGHVTFNHGYQAG